MTERKPPGVRWETWIEKQIREAAERGDFADLPGYGKPLEGFGSTDHEDWWLREKLRREDLQVLPPSLLLRREVEATMARARAEPDEDRAVALVEEINEKIRRANRLGIEGPPVVLVTFDVDAFRDEWRVARHEVGG